jgi:hypothetical protein
MPINYRVITKSLEGKSCTNSIVFLETKTNKSQMIVKIRLCMRADSLPRDEKANSPHLTSARPQAPATLVRVTASLKGFLPLRSASTCRRDEGNSEARNWAASFASVRVVTFLFMREMVLLHSRVTVGGVGSQLGRWSTISSIAGVVADASDT